MVLTGTGAAPPLPPDSWFRTLGSKCATHCCLHLSPDQCCGSGRIAEKVTRAALRSLTTDPQPSPSPAGAESHVPTWPPTSCSPLLQNLASHAPGPLPVMLADNQAQAFSVASPTAMFSALLRTCDRRTARSGGLGMMSAHVKHCPTDSSGLTRTCAQDLATHLAHQQPPSPPAPGLLPTYSCWCLLGKQRPHGSRALLLAEPARRQRRSVMSRHFSLAYRRNCAERTHQLSSHPDARGSATATANHPLFHFSFGLCIPKTRKPNI